MEKPKQNNQLVAAKIFVVDDSTPVRELLCDLLTDEGYEVQGFESGATVLESVEIAPPDLLLLDIEMPDMDGFEVCTNIKKQPQLADIPIIFISGYTETEEKVKAFQYGGVDYITKPIEMAEVTARIRTHLNLRQYQHQLKDQNQVLTQALEELKAAQSFLVQSEKMASLGQLVAGVAHEINNPVSFVYGNVHVMQRNAKRLHRYLDYIHHEGLGPKQAELREELRINHLLSDLNPLIDNTLEAAERVRDIVEDLRTFSSGNTNDKAQVNLAQAVHTAIRWVIKGERKRVELLLFVPEQLPVMGHMGQLTQVVLNLLQNALYATQTLVKPSIELRGGESENGVWLTVADNGPGIPESELGSIFDPFFTTKKVGEGTGLGLSISYTLISDLGGELTACNRPEGGALFRIELPRA